MDEKSTQLLQDILNQQKEQTELFRRYLWRLRFSLLGLLLLMTLTAVGLGIGVYLTRPAAPYSKQAQAINVDSFLRSQTYTPTQMLESTPKEGSPQQK